MFLADRTNIQAIHDASVLMFDGTFEYCPKEFYREHYESINAGIKRTSGQVYTMHAVYSDLPERQSSFLSGKLFELKTDYIFFRNCFLVTQR